MEILRYVFFLGIIYIVFSIIWFFIALLPKYILGANSNGGNRLLDYLIKGAQYYFLASLTAIEALEFVSKENIDTNNAPLFVIIGGIILYLYLAGKAERSQVMFEFKSNMGGISLKRPLKYEHHFVGLTLIFYALSFNYSFLIDNSLNRWFLENINDFYNTIIIGWIIGFIGFFFLLSMIFKGIGFLGFTIQVIINLLTGKPAPKRQHKSPFGKNNPFGNQNPFGGQNPFQNENPFQEQEPEDANIDEDDYVDFEELDDDEDDDK